MIYTITLNPALDHIIETSGFNIGETNYYNKDYVVIGGKGINVSIILNNLKANVLSTGLMGKANQHHFIDKFNELHVKTHFFFYNGDTRTNFKIKNLNLKQETEINGRGIEVDLELLTKIKTYLASNLDAGDIVVAAGSIPKGTPTTIYQEIGEIAAEKQAVFILDTSKEQMLEGLKSRPYLIKPNIEEICEILDLPFKEYSFEETKIMVDKLKKLGARNVLVSQGSQGSIFFDENGDIYKVGVAKGTLVNSVGSGDSMIAGFTYGLYKQFDLKTTLQYGAASGAATAFTQWLAERSDIEKLVKEISVEKL
ncbi:1-phosphofructokinase [Mesoplasma syrphidae]|uniref:1-phosphofructokinase n=1 Tax=Mesoplasma syrphidae TaxID=225999 RepID=A0A2K9CDL4_9MOLU|nr:1-phosphofructokinase [Mesoplasma syrphidae]AUF83744.1 1-phosphofructokinase [Mesoplasma syrphidae]